MATYNHVGPHTAACFAEGGYLSGTLYGYPIQWTTPAQPVATCQHCFCQPARAQGGVPHRSCCRCYTTLAEGFARVYHGLPPAKTDAPAHRCEAPPTIRFGDLAPPDDRARD